MECEPGSDSARRSSEIEEGDGEGERLLPVDEHELAGRPRPDQRHPAAARIGERFAILLNEFGTGLAGRGDELNEVIHRANPALRETDEVLADPRAAEPRRSPGWRATRTPALAPLARERERFADFIVPGQRDRRGLGRAPRRHRARASSCCPTSSRELRPLMVDLEGFADQGTPLLADLAPAAPALGPADQGARARSRRTASRAALPEPRRRARARPAGADPRAPADPGPEQARHAARARCRSTSTSSPRASTQTGRHRAHQRLPLLRRARHQRLRRARPLPARRPGHQPLLDLQHSGRRSRPPAPPTSTTRRPSPPTLSAAAARNAAPASAGGGIVAPTGSAARRAARQRARARPRRVTASRTCASCASAPGAGRRGCRAPTSRCSTTCSGRTTSEPAPLGRGRPDRQPGAGGRGDRAGHDRRRLPLLQRELRPAVRAHVRPQGEPPERLAARGGLRGAHRRRARRLHLRHRAEAAARTAPPTPR